MRFAMSDEEKTFIQQHLLIWFEANQRDLPWRRSYEPYHVWVAEIMGQQTQMERVVAYFNNWIARFPDLISVVRASQMELLKAWEGLGYYSRVRNLHKAAAIVMDQHGGVLPSTLPELLALPGIGPYTAAAIMSIGFNQPFPLLDANVERLFARLADIDTPVKEGKTRKRLEKMAADLLVRSAPRSFNQALMEFGALVCLPKNPVCHCCILQPACKSYAADTVDLRPLPGAKKGLVDIEMSCGIIVEGDRYFIQQRLPDDLWGGLWEFPGGRLHPGETPFEAVKREILEETELAVEGIQAFRTVVHHYTRYRVTLHGFFCAPVSRATGPVLHAAARFAWVTLHELQAYPFPAGHRQLVSMLTGKDFPEKQ